MGRDPADVRHIIVTHLDLDHAGGLGDFPEAKVHVFAPELEIAQKPPLPEKARYVQKQWAHGPDWVSHEVAGDTWFGFESVKPIEGLGDEVALVPLVGHSKGHSGIAVKGPGGWMLHCGDAYFFHGEVETPRRVTPGFRAFENITNWKRGPRMHNLGRLQELQARPRLRGRAVLLARPAVVRREGALAVDEGREQDHDDDRERQDQRHVSRAPHPAPTFTCASSHSAISRSRSAFASLWRLVARSAALGLAHASGSASSSSSSRRVDSARSTSPRGRAPCAARSWRGPSASTCPSPGPSASRPRSPSRRGRRSLARSSASPLVVGPADEVAVEAAVVEDDRAAADRLEQGPVVRDQDDARPRRRAARPRAPRGSRCRGGWSARRGPGRWRRRRPGSPARGGAARRRRCRRAASSRRRPRRGSAPSRSRAFWPGQAGLA